MKCENYSYWWGCYPENATIIERLSMRIQELVIIPENLVGWLSILWLIFTFTMIYMAIEIRYLNKLIENDETMQMSWNKRITYIIFIGIVGTEMILGGIGIIEGYYILGVVNVFIGGMYLIGLIDIVQKLAEIIE